MSGFLRTLREMADGARGALNAVLGLIRAMFGGK